MDAVSTWSSSSTVQTTGTNSTLRPVGDVPTNASVIPFTDNPQHSQVYQSLVNFDAKLKSINFPEVLATMFLFCREYDELVNSLWKEFEALERAQAACDAPKIWWQEPYNNYFQLLDNLRTEKFASHDGLEGRQPLSFALITFRQVHLKENVEVNRMQGWKTALDSWNLFNEAYEWFQEFPAQLSHAQKASFSVLRDWWNALYSGKADMDALRLKLDELQSNLSAAEPTRISSKLDWTSHSHYHSICLELFMREFHPKEYEPYACRLPLVKLAWCRQRAADEAVSMRHAFSTIVSNPQVRLSAYPQVIRDMDVWQGNRFFEEHISVDAEVDNLRKDYWDIYVEPPLYLWDIVAQKTVRVKDFERCPDYICVTHTWGRMTKKPESRVSVVGVPWPVEELTIYDVQDLPEMMRGLQNMSPRPEYVWIDLLCLPQWDSLDKRHEIGNQTAIFRRARTCIAWLNDIEAWTKTRATLNYIGLEYLYKTCNDREMLVSGSTLRAAKDAAEVVPEFWIAGSSFSKWFSSLWTLQEAALCPNLIICNRSMEILTDACGTPISLTALFKVLGKPQAPKAVPLTKPIVEICRKNWPEPRGLLELMKLRSETKISQLLNTLSPMDVILSANYRNCRRPERRAEAIMSALDATDWYKDRDLADEEEQQAAIKKQRGLGWLGSSKPAQPPAPNHTRVPLVCQTFCLPFVQELAQKVGSPFYAALAGSSKMRLTSMNSWTSFPDVHIGSMMPFNTLTQIYSAASLETLRRQDHEAVANWEIFENGSVSMKSVGVLTSSTNADDGPPISCVLTLVVDQRGFPLACEESQDLHLKLAEMAGDHSTYYAVVLWEDFGRQIGVLLQTARRRLLGVGRTYLIKVGNFVTECSAPIPKTKKVNWVVV